MVSQRQELIPLDDRRAWERALADIPHAFAHTWDSCSAMRLTTGQPTYLYVWRHGDARAACAFVERGRPPYVDVVTPYGFGGFTGVEAGPDLLVQWQEFALERGYVSGYIGLNPLFAPAATKASPDYHESNDIYVLALHRGLDAVHRALGKQRRRELRVFDASGGRLLENADRLRSHFLNGIPAFLRSRGAGAAYELSIESWAALVDSPNAFLLGVEDADDKIAAVCLVAYTADSGEMMFLLPGSEGRRFTTALVWAAATRLVELNVPSLNMGGGVRRGDGGSRFKEQFGGLCLQLGALRQVYRPTAFERLCREAGRDPSDRAGFFPPYWAPPIPTTAPGASL